MQMSYINSEFFSSLLGMMLLIMLPVFFLVIIILSISNLITSHKRKKIKKRLCGLASGTIEMTAEEFLKIREKSFGWRCGPSFSLSLNFPGVYILHNISKDKYYVGQGKEVLKRAYTHFAGRGNGDVYADYKYGDKFTIKVIALQLSGYNSLNELERDAIMCYNAYYSGYNKTRGNFKC